MRDSAHSVLPIPCPSQSLQKHWSVLFTLYVLCTKWIHGVRKVDSVSQPVRLPTHMYYLRNYWNFA